MSGDRATPEQSVLSPHVSAVLRRSLFWVGLGTAVLLIALLAVLLGGASEPGEPLAADNPAPGGAQAVAEVLGQQGVTVVATSTLDATADAAAADSTVLLYDLSEILDSAQRERLLGLADRIVLVDPSFDALDDLAPAVAQAGSVEGSLDADCALPGATRADSITGDGSGFRVVDVDADAVSCFGSGDDVYSLVEVETAGTTVTVLGTTSALSNEFVGDRGNAALALNLLGETETLIWYLPGAGDLATEGAPTIGELSPPWVTSFTALLLLTAIAAAVWRGRRFGPLVVENLPVIVRARETMQGRARLYEKNTVRLHTIDQIRIGTIARLATQCGLPRAVQVDRVIAAVAAVAGRSLTEVRGLLIDTVPTSDGQLIALSDELLSLERDVTAATRPE